MAMVFRQNFITKNRSYKKFKPIGCVIHETANDGATDKNHQKYFNNNDVKASAHVFVDWDSATQCVPYDEISFHAGKTANSKFIGIELCNAKTSEQFKLVWENSIQLFTDIFVDILKITKITKDNLMSHDEVSKKWRETDHTDPVGYFKEYEKTVDNFRADLQLSINKRIGVKEECKVISINVNGEKTDIEGKLIDGATYVSLRKLCDRLGYIVDWYENTQTANIVTSTIIPKKNEDTPFKYYTNNGCHIVEISPSKFGVNIQNKTKNEIDVSNFFNLAYFAKEDNGDLINLGNLADSGVVLGQSKDFPSWVGLYNKTLTTLVVKNDNTCSFIKTNDLSIVKDLKTAVSGIPILLNGQEVSLSKDVIVEGYDTSPFRFTWHGFLTYQNGKIIYIMAQTGDDKSPANATTVMANLLKGLGMTGTCVKLDGGGSALLKINGKPVVGTAENRKICSIGMFE